VPRAVLDPNVLVSALLAPRGTSAQLLVELGAGAFEIVTSPLLIDELRRTLGREKFRRYLTEAEADAYVEQLRSISIFVDDPEPPEAPLCSDPDDEYIITLAQAAGAAALVSGDTHLTELRGVIPVFTPREFLGALR
jgi:putative PIN family toxin of toxin-antitoxin system